MNVNQGTLDMIFEVTYRFVIITPDGSFSSSSSDLTLKKLFMSLIKYYEADEYHTAYIPPISRGLLKLVEAKPVEITREEVGEIIKRIDFYSK